LTKGPDAFRTISEAADELGVPQHVLRFWETRFSFIRPMKRAGGRRFYRPHDIVVLRGIRTLLHTDGYTIKGVQRLYREQGVRRLLAAAEHAPDVSPTAEVVDRAPAETIEIETPPAPAAMAVLEVQAGGRRARVRLTDLERRRLRAALEDLTAIKAEIDMLLAQSAG
jgi:DNA-binding transcriptional MerR regulator